MEFIDEFGESINGINWAIAAWAETFMPAAQQQIKSNIHSSLWEWEEWLFDWLLRGGPPKRTVQSNQHMKKQIICFWMEVDLLLFSRRAVCEWNEIIVKILNGVCGMKRFDQLWNGMALFKELLFSFLLHQQSIHQPTQFKLKKFNLIDGWMELIYVDWREESWRPLRPKRMYWME